MRRRLAGACPAKPKSEQGRLRPTFASQSASCQTFDDGGWDAADFRGQRPRLQLADFLTWAKTGMALFEPLTVSIRGRVPTRLRRVARWRQGIAALHSRASTEANGKPFEWATRRSRVGTGDETPPPRRRQTGEKSAKPVSGKTPQKPPRSGSLILQVCDRCGACSRGR